MGFVVFCYLANESLIAEFGEGVVDALSEDACVFC